MQKLNKLFNKNIRNNKRKTEMLGAYTVKLEERAISTCTTIIDKILNNFLTLVFGYETVTCVLTTIGDIVKYKVGFLTSMKQTLQMTK